MERIDLWQGMMKVSATLLGATIVLMTFLFGFKSLQRAEAKSSIILIMGALISFVIVLFYSIWTTLDRATMGRLDQMVLLYLMLGVGLLVGVLGVVIFMWYTASDA